MNLVAVGLIWLASSVLVIFALTAVLNVLTFPRLDRVRVGSRSEMPFVSIMIPARNEARVIGETVERILAQEYEHFELIVLDDGSDDGTGEILADFEDRRLRVMGGGTLPAGWMGKSWACHQLSQVAGGDVFIFIDADVRWERGALGAVIGAMIDSKSDLLTVWSTQITQTWAERMVVPLMSMVIMSYLPVVMVNHSPFAAFAAANGQCMAWRRGVYEALGGHRLVANNVLDDVTMARAVKAAGYRLRMVDGQGVIACRMYDGWASVRDGFAKNILAGYGNSVVALLAGWLLHWLVFLMPLVLLLVDGYRLWGVLLLLLGLGIRALSAGFTRQRVWDSLTLPMGVLLMTRIAIQALWWRWRGGVRWKGRILGQASQE